MNLRKDPEQPRLKPMSDPASMAAWVLVGLTLIGGIVVTIWILS